MLSKKILWMISSLVILFLILANVPSVSAHVPGTATGDPALDPAEAFWSTGIWSFYYGQSINYGSYLRDVQWTNTANGVTERYFGMISVPYVRINGVIYRFTSAQVTIATFTPSLPGHIQVSYFYPPIILANGDTHFVNIIYDIWDSPTGGSDARIEVFANDNIAWVSTALGCTWDVPVRVDFDIYDVSSPGSDDAYIWTGGPPTWVAQTTEITHGPAGLGTQSGAPYNLEVKVQDPPATGTYIPWGGISPYCVTPGAPAIATPDTFHLLRYNAPPILEYLGPPPPYVNLQAIWSTDNVVWDETSTWLTNGMNGNTNLKIWIA
jgi:hypothetical protein